MKPVDVLEGGGEWSWVMPVFIGLRGNRVQIYPCQGSVPAGQVVRLSGAARLPDPSGRLWRPQAGLGPRTVGGRSWTVRRIEALNVSRNLDWLILTKRPQNILKMLPPDWGRAGMVARLARCDCRKHD